MGCNQNRQRQGRPPVYKVTILALTWAAVLMCCSSPIPSHNYAREPNLRSKEFVLGPSDQLLITVWRNPNLTTNAAVRPDGTVTMPLIGDLKAAGRTSKVLRDEIKRKLANFVTDAVVTVAVTRVNSYHFTVSGKVARVGLFSAQRYLTVGEAIAMAGGPTRFSEPRRTVVVRKGENGKVRRIPVDYTAIASGTNPKMDIVILPGDTIHVP